jgi:hypothetical protein
MSATTAFDDRFPKDDTPVLQPADFDYGRCGPHANELRKTATRIRKKGRDTYLEIGRELVKVKGWLAHGLFEEWVERECQIGVRTAQRAMTAAQVADKNDKLSSLSIDALIALAPADDTIINQIAEDVEAGHIRTAHQVKDKLDEVSKPAVTETPDPTSPANSQSDESPAKAPLPSLEDLTALWAGADVKTKTLFLQHIGCGGFAEGAEQFRD